MRRLVGDSALRQAGRLLLRRPLCTAAPQAGRSALSRAAAAAGVGLGIGCGVLAWRQLAAGEASGSGSGSGSAPSSSSTWATQDLEVPRSALTARYEFKKCLGKGGFGDVWLAVEVATGKKVAVKKMSLENQSRAMVEQEVGALRRCGNHPNVGKLIEVLWVKPDAEHQCTERPLTLALALALTLTLTLTLALSRTPRIGAPEPSRRCLPSLRPNPTPNPNLTLTPTPTLTRCTEAYLVLELASGGGMFERLVSEGAYTAP